jgi:hypothetical protein
MTRPDPWVDLRLYRSRYTERGLGKKIPRVEKSAGADVKTCRIRRRGGFKLILYPQRCLCVSTGFVRFKKIGRVVQAGSHCRKDE